MAKRARAGTGAEGSGKCPITFALDVFGDRWSLIVLRDLLFKGKRHYGELLASSERISTNILADRLAKLEREGLISKRRDPSNRSRPVYGLTDKGKALLPMMLEMIAWSARYDPQPGVGDHVIEGAPPRLLERAREDRAALIEEILRRIPE